MLTVVKYAYCFFKLVSLLELNYPGKAYSIVAMYRDMACMSNNIMIDSDIKSSTSSQLMVIIKCKTMIVIVMIDITIFIQ